MWDAVYFFAAVFTTALVEALSGWAAPVFETHEKDLWCFIIPKDGEIAFIITFSAELNTEAVIITEREDHLDNTVGEIVYAWEEGTDFVAVYSDEATGWQGLDGYLCAESDHAVELIGMG